MIAEISYKNSASEELMTRKEKNTFGWRVATERDHCGLKQADVVERLATMGVKTTIVGISEIELGKRKQFQPDMIIALAKVLGVSVHYLLTGEEVGEAKSWHEETEEAAELIDKMPASSRRLVVAFARLLLAQCQQQHEEDARIVMLLQDEIKALSPVGQTTARSYIDRRA